MKITFDPQFTYRTLYLAACHLSADDLATLQHLANEPACYYVHNVDAARACIILRLVGIDSDRGAIDDVLTEDGISESLRDVIGELHEQGIEALHFDPDMDIINGAPWYTDSGTKMRLIGDDLTMLSFDDLTDTQREDMASMYGDCEAQDLNYFYHGEILYCMADVMRLADGDKEDYGHAVDGVMSGTNTCAYGVQLVDDGEAVNLYLIS